MTSGTRGLLDTSVLVARESRRALDASGFPDDIFVSVITIAELQAGVLAASDTAMRARRLATLESLAMLDPLPVDATAAAHWATFRVLLAEQRRRLNVNDLWIAAVAMANDLAVITQDRSYDALERMGGPAVIRV